MPLFLWLLLRRLDGWALIVLVLSAITDYLDGKIARAFGLESRLGQLLDPVADRLYIAATLVGLAVREVIPWWFVWLVAREVLLAVVMLVLKRAGQTGLPVIAVGKAATLNLLYAFPLLLLGTFDGWVGTAASIVGWAMVWVGRLPLLGRRRPVCRPSLPGARPAASPAGSGSSRSAGRTGSGAPA